MDLMTMLFGPDHNPEDVRRLGENLEWLYLMPPPNNLAGLRAMGWREQDAHATDDYIRCNGARPGFDVDLETERLSRFAATWQECLAEPLDIELGLAFRRLADWRAVPSGLDPQDALRWLFYEIPSTQYSTSTAVGIMLAGLTIARVQRDIALDVGDPGARQMLLGGAQMAMALADAAAEVIKIHAMRMGDEAFRTLVEVPQEVAAAFEEM